MNLTEQQKWLVAVSCAREPFTLKFRKDSVELLSGDSENKKYKNAEIHLQVWKGSITPADIGTLAAFNKLNNDIPFLLNERGYPSITLIVTVVERGLINFKLYSEELKFGVGEFDVRLTDLFPSCFRKTFILIKDCVYQEITGNIFGS
ncbi:hypothetical protein, partial [Lysinibacillus xylanilyticus]|uniref:hypothetical protein n=1 Tax=Lysinibacillus xylanilyticus TaxID=582475 RepID=UPI0036DF47B2